MLENTSAEPAAPHVRFGLVGYGAWGGHHAAAIVQTPGAVLRCVCVRAAASRQRAAADHPAAEVVADYRELVRRDDVDVVDVVLPSHLHAEVATSALEAGKHVLLEKPMALKVEDCRRLIELADRHRRLLAVGHELRLSSLWGKLRQLVDDGAIGRPKYVLIELWRNPYRLGSGGWRFDIERVGNWILEEPIHFFDLARWYLHAAGNPLSIFARANSRQAEHPELQDNFSAMVNFPGDAYAVVTQTLCGFEHHQTVKLTGTEGSLWARWSGAMDRTRQPTFGLKHFNGDTVRDIPLEKITGELFELEDQIAMMVRAIKGGGPLSATGVDGMWSVAMCLAAQRSVDSGKPVQLDLPDATP